MKRILGALVVATAVLVASPAAAQVSIDLKVGYGVPAGSIVQGMATSSVVTGSMPLEVAARWRFNPNLSAGVYYQYVPLFFQTSFCGPAACTGWDMRTGAEVVYSFLPGKTASPWLGLGTGWEWSQARLGRGSSILTMAFNGWEIFNLQAGVDFFVAREFVFGPYVGFFGGVFTSATVKTTIDGSTDSTTETVPSSDRTFHGQWQFGLRGTFNL